MTDRPGRARERCTASTTSPARDAHWPRSARVRGRMPLRARQVVRARGGRIRARRRSSACARWSAIRRFSWRNPNRCARWSALRARQPGPLPSRRRRGLCVRRRTGACPRHVESAAGVGNCRRVRAVEAVSAAAALTDVGGAFENRAHAGAVAGRGRNRQSDAGRLRNLCISPTRARRVAGRG